MYENEDYLVVDVNGKKKLVKVTDATNNKGIVIDKSASHTDTQEYIDLEEQEVIASIGKQPPFGSVYGVKVEPYNNKDGLDPWGNIYYFRNLTEADKNKIQEALEKCSNKMKVKGIDYVFPIDVEVRNPRGKTTGKSIYKVDKQGNETKVLQIYYNGLEDKLDETIYHELGHFLWFTGMSDEYKAKWLELYSSGFKVTPIDEETLQEVLTDITNEGPQIKEEYNTDNDLTPTCEEVFKFIKDYHGLTYKDLCLMYKAGFDISKYFPTHVQLLEHQEVVTEYGKKSVEELFAESFRLYALKEAMPEEARLLVIETRKNLTPLNNDI